MSYRIHMDKINQKIEDDKMLAIHFNELRTGIKPW